MSARLLPWWAALLLAMAALPAAARESAPTLQGVLRARGEVRDNADFDDRRADADSLGGLRLRAMLRARLHPLVELAVQPQVTALTRRNRPGVAHGLLHQGYVEVGDGEWSARLGRQELNYGDQRLVGAFGWDHFGRSFDALRLRYHSGEVRADLFFGTQARNPTTRRSAEASLSGADVTWKSGLGPVSFYALVKNDYNRARIAHTTLGVRADLEPVAGFHLKGEGAVQNGTNGSRHHRAHAWTFTLAHRPREGWLRALEGEVNFASGDADPADGVVETFDQLYPTNHLWYGMLDYQGWRNTRHLRLGLAAAPTEELTVALDHHWFSLAEPRDAWYRASGAVFLRDPTGRSGTDTGRELDLKLRWKAHGDTVISGGWGWFFPGGFVARVRGRADPSWWGYLQLEQKL